MEAGSSETSPNEPKERTRQRSDRKANSPDQQHGKGEASKTDTGCGSRVKRDPFQRPYRENRTSGKSGTPNLVTPGGTTTPTQVKKAHLSVLTLRALLGAIEPRVNTKRVLPLTLAQRSPPGITKPKDESPTIAWRGGLVAPSGYRGMEQASGRATSPSSGSPRRTALRRLDLTPFTSGTNLVASLMLS